MASVSSNRAEVERKLQALASALRFTSPAPGGGTVAGAVVSTTVEAIKEQTIDRQLQPDGSGLRELSDHYRAWKTSHGFPETIGILERKMLADSALKGRVDVTPTQLTMTHGDTAESMQHAQYFRDGGREFYGVGSEGEKILEELFNGILTAACGQSSRVRVHA